MFAYDASNPRNYDNAGYVLKCMQQSSEEVNIKVETPEWIEIPTGRDIQSFEKQLDVYIKKNGNPSIVLIMVSLENLYAQFKNICYKKGIVSQCLMMRTVKKFDKSIASNILR